MFLHIRQLEVSGEFFGIASLALLHLWNPYSGAVVGLVWSYDAESYAAGSVHYW